LFVTLLPDGLPNSQYNMVLVFVMGVGNSIFSNLAVSVPGCAALSWELVLADLSGDYRCPTETFLLEAAGTFVCSKLSLIFK